MQNQHIATMFTVQGMRKFVCDRLTEAAQEILGVFEKRAQEYELELARQRRLLESVYSPANALLSDPTDPLIKEEQNDVCITDVQQPVTSTSLQDVHGEHLNLNPKEVHNSARKETEATNAPHPVTGESSNLQPFATPKPIMGNKQETPAKHHKCSHGYRLPKGSASKQTNALLVPSSNMPKTLEVIEIEDNSPTSSDIEIIQGEKHPGLSLTNFINETICDNAATEFINVDNILQEKHGASAIEIPSQVKFPSSAVSETNEEDNGNLIFTDLDAVQKISYLNTDDPFMYKDATYNTASTSFTGLYASQIDTGIPSNVINDLQSMFAPRDEIKLSASSETTQTYSYEWKRPILTKAPDQDKKNPFECDICGRVSSNFKSYKSHMKSHTAEKKFKCETCGKMFRESCDLNKHQKIHTGEKPFTCLDCGKAFNRRFNLDLHKRVHTGEKPYACGSCEKAFTSRVNLRKHERIHTGEKPYICDHCQKEFADSSSFRNHQRVHTGEKPYKCCFCKKEFATRTTLKRHIRVHTGEKPYKCSRCDKSFATNTDRKVHTRIHTGEKPYKCENCGQEFSSWTNYNRHTNIHKPKAEEPIMQSQP